MSAGCVLREALRPRSTASVVRRRRLHIVSEAVEVRVCVNRTCSRSGSRETLLLLEGLAPPFVSVVSCGCLGFCGSGPNVAVLPEGAIVRHCSTASRVADVLAGYCGVSNPAASLESLALRKRAEAEMEDGDFAEAITVLSQAIDLKPSGGMHFLYKTRSTARLSVGDLSGALHDATEASKIAPRYPQGDALFAMEEYAAAEEAYSTALQIDPILRHSKSFKARITKLQVKTAAANTP